MMIDPSACALLRDAVLDRAPVSLGQRRTTSPHEFYRYPARFSPRFAAAVIQCFSDIDDVILDPFVGGGTTAVEGLRLGRLVVGADLNPIATFVTRAKTSSLSEADRTSVKGWLGDLERVLKVSRRAAFFSEWEIAGYFKDLNTTDTWRIRKLVGLALSALLDAPPRAQQFCRCVVLRTAQWALDMRRSIPSVSEFRTALRENGEAMLKAIDVFNAEVIDHREPIILDVGLPGLADQFLTSGCPTPTLVVTSPPYPGVYVNYHRWKLRGRREIPAPYWITNHKDGNGLAHYTMSARAEPTLNVYFSRLLDAFRDLARIVNTDTLVVQVVGFNDPQAQLDRYLATMGEAGFREVAIGGLATADDGRLWRSVPGRRWWTEAHARKSVAPHTSREAVLFHRQMCAD